MAKILKHPVTYFFALGFVVFGLHAILDARDRAEAADPYVVDITSADIEWLRSSWESRMQRKPDPSELNGLIDSYIREEIMAREAHAMGLDKEDQVIKRRLVQKLTFVLEDVAEANEPNDDTLRQYAEDNKDRYREPGVISFAQVYLNPERRADVMGDAEDLLQQLRGGNVNEPASLGDATMLGHQFHDLSQRRAVNVLGSEFADALFALEAGRWQGPIPSAYGLHIVRIDERVEPRMPEFEQIREEVRNDFMYLHKNQVVDDAYTAVRSRYTVLVEGLPHE